MVLNSIHGSKKEKDITKKEGPPLTAKDWPDAPEGIATDSRCICWFGYVCEDHPNKPWEHNDCHAAGDPCPRPDCPYKDNSDAIFATVHCQVQPGKKKPPVRKTRYVH